MSHDGHESRDHHGRNLANIHQKSGGSTSTGNKAGGTKKHSGRMAGPSTQAAAVNSGANVNDMHLGGIGGLS